MLYMAWNQLTSYFNIPPQSSPSLSHSTNTNSQMHRCQTDQRANHFPQVERNLFTIKFLSTQRNSASTTFHYLTCKLMIVGSIDRYIHSPQGTIYGNFINLVSENLDTASKMWPCLVVKDQCPGCEITWNFCRVQKPCTQKLFELQLP